MHCVVTTTTTPVQRGEMLSTSNGGKTWHLASFPSRLLLGTDLTCPSVSRCYLLTGNYSEPNKPLVHAWVSSNLGKTWTAESELPDPDFAEGLDCPSPSTCVAYGSIPSKVGPETSIAEAYKTVNGGTTWIHSTIPAQVTDIQSMYCTNSGSCWAFGSTAGNDFILTSTDAGDHWSVQATTMSVEGVTLSPATCWSPGSCLLTTGDQQHTFALTFRMRTGCQTASVDAVNHASPDVYLMGYLYFQEWTGFSIFGSVALR
jgi:hypothetical protein